MIELRTCIAILARGFVLLVVCAVAGGAIGVFATTGRASVSASVTASLQFSGLHVAAGDAVSYDGYYLVENERRFGELLAEVLRSGSFRDQFSASTQTRIGRVERITDTDYRVLLRGEEGAIRASEAVLEQQLADTMQGLSSESGEALRVRAFVSAPTFLVSFSPRSAAGVGTFLGVLFAACALLLRQYLSDGVFGQTKAASRE